MAIVVRLEDDTSGHVRRLVALMCAAENGQVALTEHDETVAVLIDPRVLASLLDTIDLFAEGRRGPRQN
jgi:hypothetical protein